MNKKSKKEAAIKALRFKQADRLRWERAKIIVALVILCSQGLGIGFEIVASAQAQSHYPARPIRMIVAWPAGGGTDVLARIVSQHVGDVLKQPVVVDNRGGASTIIGTEMIVKAPPDGYTLGFATSNLAVNPALFAKLPYEALRDLMPVSLVAKGLYVVAVHPSLPVKSIKALIELSRSQPSGMMVSLAGPGTPTHLALAQFNSLMRAQWLGIHYKGAAPAVTALLSGETQLMFVSYPSVAQQAASGRIRLLAVTSEKRSKVLASLPTAQESGLPGFVIEEWYGIVAPAKTDKVLIGRINEAIHHILSLEGVTNLLALQGAEANIGSSEAFGEFIRSQTEHWAKVVKEAHLRVE